MKSKTKGIQMQTMTLEDIAELTEVKNEGELLTRLKKHSVGLGFEQFACGIEISRPLLKPIQHMTSGYAIEWQKQYLDRQYTFIDPTVLHCILSRDALVWSDNMYTTASRELQEEAGANGISHGVSVPIHERQGVKSMLNLVRDQSITRNQNELNLMLAGAKILASIAHFSLIRVVVPDLFEAKDPKVTPKEKDCLIWAAKGKTAFEIGMILNISEATVVFHLKNIVRKFNVANRTQAIAYGVALGIVT
jgi:DNA-binding CsgD family transcriptional regulator